MLTVTKNDTPWWSWPINITEEQWANDRFHLEDQAADHSFRVNRFLHPRVRLSEAWLIIDRADVLRENHYFRTANSYLEQIIENPDEIGGRRRYMSLRDSRGSTDWLKRILASANFESSVLRAMLIRLLTAKLATAKHSPRR